VKETNISGPLGPGLGIVQGARYRYFSTPPSTVRLRLGDVASQIPETVRLPAFDAEHSVDLPCEDVFGGPVPRLLLSRLAEIAQDHLRLRDGSDLLVNLPAAQLALAYRFIEEREPLDEVISPRVESRNSQSREGSDSVGEMSNPVEDSARCMEDDAGQGAETAEKKSDVPPLLAGAQVSDPIEERPLKNSWERSPAERPSADATTIKASRSPAVSSNPQEELSSKAAGTPLTSSSGSDELREPRKAFDSPELQLASAHPVQLGAEPARAKPAPTVIQEAVLIETADLSAAGSKPTTELPDQDTLQAIFMTEEFLSVDRVVELSGGLPGIKSCVLAHEAAVLASHNVPETIDLVSLSAHALELLAAIRQSAARMGVGAVPAVTIHSDKGPITFFSKDELCLLVLHKDRGFVPGVREKLQQVVEYLSKATLALLATAPRSSIVPKTTF
jgi:predicted regulator of Ras-like GTPase activity (Roadblock/LC7/MglB family)